MNCTGTLLPERLHRLAAVLGLFAVLVLGVLAVRPDLHELVCHHHAHDAACAQAAGQDEDGCVVTHFAAGQVLVSLAPVLVVVFSAFVVAVLAPRRAEVVVMRALRLPPACGPPRG